MPVEMTEARIHRAVLALARVTKESNFVAVGRATLGITAPSELQHLSVSDDVDMFTVDDELAGLDEAREQLGESSPFHEANGFYIERVGKWTLMTQPTGWEERAKLLEFDDISLRVISPLDLAYNKLEANRPKDREFFREAFSQGLFSAEEVAGFIEEHAENEERRITLLGNLEATRAPVPASTASVAQMTTLPDRPSSSVEQVRATRPRSGPSFE